MNADRDQVMDYDLAFEIVSAIVACRRARGQALGLIFGSTEGGPTVCRRGFYLIRSGLIAVSHFPMTCIGDMNGRGYHFNAGNFGGEIDVSPPPATPDQLGLFA